MKTSLAVSTTLFVLSLFLLAVPVTSRADNLFVHGNGIYEINSSGTATFFASGSGLNADYGVACDSAGNVYGIGYTNAFGVSVGIIEKFNSSGVGTVVAGPGGFPQSIANDNAGDVFWTYTGAGVSEVTASGTSHFYGLSGDAAQPTLGGLACDNSGNVYVSLFNGSTYPYYYWIGKLNTNPYGVGTFAELPNPPPSFLACDKNGDVFASYPYDGTIEEYNTNGVGTVFASGLNDPRGLAFDSAGNLYVANCGDGTIEEFNTNGVGTVFASGLDGPKSLAFQPVPEPSTWAMVAMGIGGVLGGRRMRRRSS